MYLLPANLSLFSGHSSATEGKGPAKAENQGWWWADGTAGPGAPWADLQGVSRAFTEPELCAHAASLFPLPGGGSRQGEVSGGEEGS